jgi:tetratricopeptide (TPR) repeat protein
MERYKEALSIYDQAIQLDPCNADIYAYKGEALFFLKRYEEAIAAYNKACQLDTAYTSIFAIRERELFNSLNDKEGEAYYNQNSRLEPKNIRMHTKKQTIPVNRTNQVKNANRAKMMFDEGKAFYKSRDFKKAYQAFEQALQLDPNNAAIHEARGAVLYELKRYKEAGTSYEQAVQLDPIYQSSYIAKSDELLIEGKSLYTSKLYEESLIVFEQAIQFHHLNKRAYILKKWAQDRIAHSKANRGGLRNKPFRYDLS